MYKDRIKPALDKLLAFTFVLLFWWLYIVIAILVRVKLGSPVLFVQKRPGKINPKTGKEVIFKLYKYRTMSDKRDTSGKLLPDEERLTKFGQFLRSTSLDEIPEILFNILLAPRDIMMSWCGPRPQLVRDLVFMSDRQRRRHTVRPGLTGLAQVMGRNSISWDEKIEWDLKYIDRITFFGDLKILIITVKKVLGNDESDAEIDITDDYGDALLKEGRVTREEYDRKQKEAERLLSQWK